jgi:hypothetical protein
MLFYYAITNRLWSSALYIHLTLIINTNKCKVNIKRRAFQTGKEKKE